jgi:hypothetical protein
MHPDVRHGLPLLREPDHVHRWGITTPPARSALQRRFKFPYRCVARTPDVLERNAGLGFAAAAFDLQPTAAAIEALPDGRRRLRRPAQAFHPQRPRVGFRAIGLTDGFFSPLAGMFGVQLRRAHLTAPDDFARLRAHWVITAGLARAGNATRISYPERRRGPMGEVNA